jgi:hypothetical protein
MKEEKSISLWGVRESKKNAPTAKNPPVFSLNFPKGVEHAPDHVITPIFSSNKKLQGFEHAHLKLRSEKADLSTFWARPT